MADSWFPTAVISHFYSAVYITAQCVNDKCRLVLASMPMGAFSFTPKFVRKIVQFCRDVGVKPRLILLDREFYSTDVIDIMRNPSKPHTARDTRQSSCKV